jgi:hypothetical protein
MASFQEVLRIYHILSYGNIYGKFYANKLNAAGNITISIRDFILIGFYETDDKMLEEYESLMRSRNDPMMLEFKGIVGMTWNENTRKSKREFIFNIPVQYNKYRHLISRTSPIHENTEMIIDSSVQLDVPLSENTEMAIDSEVQQGVSSVTPLNVEEKKRKRESKKPYSPDYLAKLVQDLHLKVMSTIKDHLIGEFVNIKPNHNPIISGALTKTMKSLITDYDDIHGAELIKSQVIGNVLTFVEATKLCGKHSKGQMRTHETIAMALSGNGVSERNLMKTSGFNRRTVKA